MGTEAPGAKVVVAASVPSTGIPEVIAVRGRIDGVAVMRDVTTTPGTVATGVPRTEVAAAAELEAAEMEDDSDAESDAEAEAEAEEAAACRRWRAPWLPLMS